MQTLRRSAILLLTSLIISLSALAEQRFEFMWGHQTTRCTYLSPLSYTGPGYGLAYEWHHASWRNKTVGMQARADFNYGYLLSPAQNSRMYDLTLDLEWGVEKIWNTGSEFKFSAGATAGVDGGVIYLPRNGNNPAQGLMWAGASLTACGEYSKIKLCGKRLSISESIEVPTIGCFFCPAYGETYYEIYVGNHFGLAHFGWWGNRPQVKSRLRADWQLGKYALTLGFDYRFQGLECNDISTRLAQCSGIIGIKF